LDYNTVFYQTSPSVTTVYIGNLGPEISETDLRSNFSQYGLIEEVKTYHDKGYGFVRFQSHEIAAKAIVGSHGSIINGRQIRCAWGKDKTGNSTQNSGQSSHHQQQQQQPQQQPQQQLPQQLPQPSLQQPSTQSAFPVWPFFPVPGMTPFGIPPYYGIPPIYGGSTWGGWPSPDAEDQQ